MDAIQTSSKDVSASGSKGYAARLEVDYPETLEKFSTFLRLFFVIPIAIILSLVNGSAGMGNTDVMFNRSGEVMRRSRDTGSGIAMGISVAVALMIVFCQLYPRWWFDFLRELTRFGARVGAYFFLLTDKYPSTVDEQSVHLEIDYPDVKKDLNRWMPLVKWFLAIPHYFLLVFLALGAFFAAIYAWFVILITGQYPRGVFDYIVGVMRWGLRVQAYASLLVTDVYPPFSLK